MVIKSNESKEKEMEEYLEEVGKLEKIIDGKLCEGEYIVHLQDYSWNLNKKERQIISKIKKIYREAGWNVYRGYYVGDGHAPGNYYLEFKPMRGKK